MEKEPDGKPYICTKKGCNGRQHFRGKVYKEHWKYRKYRKSVGPMADTKVVDEIHEPSVKKIVDEVAGIAEYSLDELQLATVDRMLDTLNVKRARRILEKVVVRSDGYRALWRLQVWTPKKGKDIPFSTHESQKYKILIELDKGNKFRWHAKRKWKKYLKENGY